MAAFTKKPVTIEAMQVPHASDTDARAAFNGWLAERDRHEVSRWSAGDQTLIVRTIHGEEAVCRVGDWVIPEREEGRFYPCKPDIFAASYAPTLPSSSHDGGGRGLSFGQAIEQAKAGDAIARDGWNGKGMFVVLMPALYLPPFNTQDTARKVNDRTAKWIGEGAPLDCQPYFAMYTAMKQWQPGWLASQADMLADDWCVVQGASQSRAA